MSKIHQKKYIRFKWWQYRRWFASIIIVIFCLGCLAGYFIRDFLDGITRWSTTSIVPDSGVELHIDTTQPAPEQGDQQDKNQ
jgi:hypothetical protein